MAQAAFYDKPKGHHAKKLSVSANSPYLSQSSILLKKS